MVGPGGGDRPGEAGARGSVWGQGARKAGKVGCGTKYGDHEGLQWR